MTTANLLFVRMDSKEMYIFSKGNGNIVFYNIISGAQTTVQTWLTIIDSGGNTRYIPCF